MNIDLSNIAAITPVTLTLRDNKVVTATAPVSVQEHIEFVGWWQKHAESELFANFEKALFERLPDIVAIAKEALQRLAFTEEQSAEILQAVGPLSVLGKVVPSFLHNRAEQIAS